ncbi:MAG: PAS-domain containing protein [Sphingomonadaceae bacterium]|nr:PAS-domain containing protein [Sphingomonadaceae bacterium]
MDNDVLRPILIAAVMGAWIGVALYVLSRGRDLPLFRKARESRVPVRVSRLNDAPNPIWLRDISLSLTFANSAYAALAGCDSGQEVVLRQRELSPRGKALAAEARDRSQPSIESVDVKTGGAIRPMDFVHVPLAGHGVVCVAIDTAKPRESANKALADTIDLLPAGIALFERDARALCINAAFCELFRLDPELARTRPLFDDLLDAMYQARRLPETSDFPGWRRQRREWFQPVLMARSEEWRLSTGEVLAVSAHRLGGGGLLLVIEDETDRTRAEGERAAALATHRATLDLLPEAIAVLAPDGTVKLTNRRACDMLNLAADADASGRTIEELIGPVSLPDGGDGIRDLVAAATAGREERRGLMWRGGEPLQYRIDPLPDGTALLVIEPERELV